MITFAFLTTYLLGGLTFLPVLLCLVGFHAYFTFPVHTLSKTSTTKVPTDPLHDTEDDSLGVKSRESISDLAKKFRRGHEPDVAAGYFAVCREYVPGGINGKPPERTTPAGAVIAAESPSVYQSMYRSIFDRKQGPSLDPGKGNGRTVKRARNVFFVVLRHGHLMLYEDSEQIEVKHVISLELHDVSIYGAEEIIPEGELWIKRNAIRLVRKPSLDDSTITSKPFFFFSENCSEKEDFYFALLQNQEFNANAPNNPPRPQYYESKHIIGLVQKLHSSEEQLQTRWINALAGRLFLALYKTNEIEDFVRTKITKKIARAKKPAFLSRVVLQKVDMGESAPHITNPRLKDLTIDGDCCVEADFHYSGNFRLEVAATARIDLGARFKAREVNLVLAVVVKKLDGHAFVKFKPPPSNRIWISFETMPDMDMAIEPIVSSRQITYGVILRAIESRIREVMAETVVLPHWDDSPFTNTVHQKFRGGIWSNRGAQNTSVPEHTKVPDEELEDEADVRIDTTLITPGLLHTKDEAAMSTPAFSGPISMDPSSRVAAASSTNAIHDLTKEVTASGSLRHVEPPKALRARSFASAANPLVSMDNANVDSIPIEKRSKQQQDATSAMIAISNRSQPTSPSTVTSPDAPIFWEVGKQPISSSTTIADMSFSSEKTILQTTTPNGPSQTSSASTPTNSRSRSPRSTLDGNVTSQSSSEATQSEKRSSIPAISAVTVAAKKWGWGVLSRTADLKSQPDSHRASTPKHPIGRGRPLPPPGQPLPFPEGHRSKIVPISSQRKPVPQPALHQRQQDETKSRSIPPPPLPVRKRQSTHVDDEGNEVLLVVEAPPESEPSSPDDNKRDGSLEVPEHGRSDRMPSSSNSDIDSKNMHSQPTNSSDQVESSDNSI